MEEKAAVGMRPNNGRRRGACLCQTDGFVVIGHAYLVEDATVVRRDIMGVQK